MQSLQYSNYKSHAFLIPAIIKSYFFCKLDKMNPRCDCNGPMMNEYCCRIRDGKVCCNKKGLDKLNN